MIWSYVVSTLLSLFLAAGIAGVFGALAWHRIHRVIIWKVLWGAIASLGVFVIGVFIVLVMSRS